MHDAPFKRDLGHDDRRSARSSRAGRSTRSRDASYVTRRTTTSPFTHYTPTDSSGEPEV